MAWGLRDANALVFVTRVVQQAVQAVVQLLAYRDVHTPPVTPQKPDSTQ
jgi:hypothetical protein